MKQLRVAVMILVVVAIAYGQDSTKRAEKGADPNYRWIQMYWWPQNFTYSFRLCGPFALKPLGPIQHLTLGYLDYYKGSRSFNVAYVMLESHKIMFDRPTISIFGGVGNGSYDTFSGNPRPNGNGFLLVGGVQLQTKRLVGDMRVNWGRGTS